MGSTEVGLHASGLVERGAELSSQVDDGVLAGW